MTNEEAIRMIKNSQDYKYSHYEFTDRTGKAFDKAIEALEFKQKYSELVTPRKPNCEGDGYDDKGNMIYDTYICPNCDKHYELDYEDYAYCPDCGQALLWGDEE